MLKIIFVFFIFLTTAVCADESNNAKAAATNAQLGLAYLNKNMYPQAQSRLQTALQEDPKSPASWYSMAYYYEKTNNLKLADQYYQKAISIDPHSGSAYNNYGTFLCRQGNYKAAISEFLTAINQKDYAFVAGAYENAGMCALRIPNRPLAEQYFEKAIDNNPNMPYSLLCLARLNFKNGNTVAAERYFGEFSEIAGVTTAQITQFRVQVFKKT